MRGAISTQEEYGGCQRKLVWFSRHANGIYFEAANLTRGVHTSLHKDGRVWRTSPATGGRARFKGYQVPVAQLQGWIQMGTSMMSKGAVISNPCVKAKDIKPGNQLIPIPFEAFPSEVINIVIEFADPSSVGRLADPEFMPPPGAIVEVIDLDGISAVVTLIGHDNQLLIKPIPDGFEARHYNFRYSVNRPGEVYDVEANS